MLLKQVTEATRNVGLKEADAFEEANRLLRRDVVTAPPGKSVDGG